MFINEITLNGRLVKKRKIRDNLYLIKIFTDGPKDSKNVPNVICRGELTKQLDSIALNDYIIIEAKFQSGRIIKSGVEQRTTNIVATSIKKAESLAEQLGFNIPSRNSAKNYENKFQVSGILKNVTSKSGGYHVLFVDIPETVPFSFYTKKKLKEELHPGSIICLSGVVQTKNVEIIESDTNESISDPSTENNDSLSFSDLQEDVDIKEAEVKQNKHFEHREKFVVFDYEIIDVSNFIRR